MTTLTAQLNALLSPLQNSPNMPEIECDEILFEIGDLLGYEDRVFDYFYSEMQNDFSSYSVHDLINEVVETSSYLETEDTTSYL